MLKVYNSVTAPYLFCLIHCGLSHIQYLRNSFNIKKSSAAKLQDVDMHTYYIPNAIK